MTVRAVLFDLDGVLVDTRDAHYEALNAALVENGCARIEPAQHRELYDGLPTARKVEMLVARGLVDPVLVPDVLSSKRLHTTRLLSRVVVFDPATYCLLAGVRASGRRVAVVSNATRDTVLSVCARLRLTDLVDVFVSNEDGPPKPDPFLYRYACDRLGVSARECLAVEDGKYGVESARRAGCAVLEVRGPAEVTPENVWGAMC